ncbi:sodium-dependent dopamine transporter-like, partial [Orbicella faveolata]|uniref:sodium-dependent dopamine transporter-like n=1 Tax=Orbicella faveolata TaxID=48498 RepID=UPI0009E54180
REIRNTANISTDENANPGSGKQLSGEEKVEPVQVEEREKRGRKGDFILSSLGYCVGFGNIWRFPYLAYKNGGALFLIPYLLMLFLNGVPLFFLELAIGQWFSSGVTGVWKSICPLMKCIYAPTVRVQDPHLFARQ